MQPYTTLRSYRDAEIASLREADTESILTEFLFFEMVFIWLLKTKPHFQQMTIIHFWFMHLQTPSQFLADSNLSQMFSSGFAGNVVYVVSDYLWFIYDRFMSKNHLAPANLWDWCAVPERSRRMRIQKSTKISGICGRKNLYESVKSVVFNINHWIAV